MLDHYILDGRELVRVDNFLAWAFWMETHAAERTVAKTIINDDVGVSTVFLGFDHAFTMSPTPVHIFETMIFGGPLNLTQWRYATWDDAAEGHERAVRLARRDKAEPRWRGVVRRLGRKRRKNGERGPQ